MVKNIVYFQHRPALCTEDFEVVLQTYVARVPRLHIVVRYVFLLIIAFTRIDKAVVERPIAVSKVHDSRAAVVRNIRNLVLEERVGSVGNVRVRLGKCIAGVP